MIVLFVFANPKEYFPVLWALIVAPRYCRLAATSAGKPKFTWLIWADRIKYGQEHREEVKQLSDGKMKRSTGKL